VKHLILIRHAQAESRLPGQSDLERPLSARGEREARATGEALLASVPLPALIICSRAARAVATARIIASVIGLPESGVLFQDAVYNSSFPALLHVIAAFPDEDSCVAMVGHNPSISDLAGILADAADIGMGGLCTGGALRIALAATTWRQAARTHGPAVKIAG